MKRSFQEDFLSHLPRQARDRHGDRHYVNGIEKLTKYRYAQTGGESCNTTAKPGELCPKQTLEEYRTEFTMWSMASSPLLVSTDVRKLTVRKRSF